MLLARLVRSVLNCCLVISFSAVASSVCSSPFSRTYKNGVEEAPSAGTKDYFSSSLSVLLSTNDRLAATRGPTSIMDLFSRCAAPHPAPSQIFALLFQAKRPLRRRACSLPAVSAAPRRCTSEAQHQARYFTLLGFSGTGDGAFANIH